jgi:tRNA-Thr(GGU) m(6)t(6)A37 methyltransferase TsaA
MMYEFEPIGVICSCFKEKFGIPRQPGLVSEARAFIQMMPPYDCEKALKGIRDFTHIWLLFVFHKNMDKRWKATVRPPRLGGNRRIGVFATRSGFRPNPIGMSVVRLMGIEKTKGRLLVHVKGVDLLDKTPILDIKPYLPYCDRIAAAQGGYAHEPPAVACTVAFSRSARKALEREVTTTPYLKKLIIQILQNDPRPAYYNRRAAKADCKRFGTRILDLEVRWKVEGRTAIVTTISKCDDKRSVSNRYS